MMLFIFILCCLLYCYCEGYTVNCGNNQCQNSFINCPPRENCLVSCIANQSCMKSIINCPVSGDCDIQCVGDNACRDIVIDATLLSGDFNIDCAGSIESETSDREHCSGMKIYGNTLPSNHGTFNIKCNGYASCINSEICCPFNGDCNLFCSGDTSCEYSMITGPQHSDLTIHCDSVRSCLGSRFNGAQASKLNMTGCTQYKSCLDVAIYCPPHSNGHKNCFVEGNDNLGKDKGSKLPTLTPTFAPIMPTLHPTVQTITPTSAPTYNPTHKPTYKPSMAPISYPGKGIEIYAFNGWQDIDIKYSGTFSESHYGMMICGDNYDTACDIAKTNWTCDTTNCDGNDLNILPTHVPILISTIHNNNDNITNNVTATEKPLGVMDIMNHTNNNNNNNNNLSTITIQPTAIYNNETQIKILYSDRVSGDIFILSGVGLVIITCLCVGCAQIRKNIRDINNGDKHIQVVSRSKGSTPEDCKYSASSRSQRSHPSHPSHPSQRGSRSRSIYDHPIQQ